MKIKNKFLIISIVLSALFICFSGVYSYAEEYYTHTAFVEEHFEWVQDDGSGHDNNTIVSHYPENVVGSCPYTAMSLLLSFYDAYLDDRFVPDDYETIGLIDEKTGNIRQEYHLNLENTEWEQILNAYVEENEEISTIEEIPEDKKKELYDQFIVDR